MLSLSRHTDALVGFKEFLGNFRIPSLRKFRPKFRHCEGAKRPKQSLGILDFCGVLGAAAPKGSGRSP